MTDKETVAAFLADALTEWGNANGAQITASDTPLAVGPKLAATPDLCVFFTRRGPPRRGAIAQAPDIAIAVLARGHARDPKEMQQQYAALGARFYWRVDVEQRVLEAYELSDTGGYELAARLGESLDASVPGAPGLALDLPRLWSRLAERQA
jgi:hypothetical protein